MLRNICFLVDVHRCFTRPGRFQIYRNITLSACQCKFDVSPEKPYVFCRRVFGNFKFFAYQQVGYKITIIPGISQDVVNASELTFKHRSRNHIIPPLGEKTFQSEFQSIVITCSVTYIYPAVFIKLHTSKIDHRIIRFIKIHRNVVQVLIIYFGFQSCCRGNTPLITHNQVMGPCHIQIFVRINLAVYSL